MKNYDLIVVGGGIAGLAIAEMFSRADGSVLLIEKEDAFGSDASGGHHSWFHFGSLYSIFPENGHLKAMVEGTEDLIIYYSGFEGMNIKINGKGKLHFPDVDNKWINDQVINYIVASRNDPDFDLSRADGIGLSLKKLFFIVTWEMAIKQFISRHTRFHRFDWRNKGASSFIPRAGWWDYTREYIKKPENKGINLDKDTHFSISGYDRTMNSRNILKDLLKSFLYNGGENIMGAQVSGRAEKAGGQWKISANGLDCRGKKIIYASGRALAEFNNDEIAVKVMASPLLVVYPAISDQCFVRMTPFYDKTVNHLCHCFKGSRYSLIGGGYFANPDSSESMDNAIGNLKAMAATVFPDLGKAEIIESYFSYKTEYVRQMGERNYKYKLKEMDDGLFSVIPGKYSLAFSLAAHTFTHITGKVPESVKPAYKEHEINESLVSLMKGEEIISRN